MSELTSLPGETGVTCLPATFFNHLMPAISNLTELKLVLYIIYLIQKKGESFSGITAEELSANPTIQHILSADMRPAEEVIQTTLGRAISQGILIHLSLNVAGKQEDVYVINNTASKEGLAGTQSVTKSPVEILPGNAPGVINKEEYNIFTLYEENIGMLTPMIAEQLKEAQQIYPSSWVKDAFREAASLNKRNWRYIEKILQRWGLEGRGHGPSGRYTKENDPDKYIKGKYGHIVRR